MTKVFGIGFQKTGTTSLGRALEVLGYRVHGVLDFTDPDISEVALSQAMSIAEHYDGFQDFPWAIYFKELDEYFPNSKFILTVRPTDKWIKSVVKHFGHRAQPMRTWVYGVKCAAGNEDVYIEKYERHNREVVEYFKDRPNDLLVLRISEGEGWDELCSFLGKEVPGIDFPEANKHSDRWKRRLRRYMKHPLKSLRSVSLSYMRSFRG